MKRQAFLLGLLVLFSVKILAQQAGISVGLSPVPIWPATGVIPQPFKDHYVFFDPSNNQMVFAYPPNLGQASYAQDPMPRQVERVSLESPIIASLSVTTQKQGLDFNYHYRISNSARAKEAIVHVNIATSSLNVNDDLAAPENWNSVVHASQVKPILVPSMKNSMDMNLNLNWHAQGTAGIEPGRTLDGFNISTDLKPGFVWAYVDGEAPLTLSKRLPQVVLKQATPLLQSMRTKKNILTVGPRFTDETPMLKMVENFHSGIQHLIREGKINGNSPAVSEALRVLENYSEEAARQNFPVEEWGESTPLVFNEVTQQGLETNILNAMKLSLN
jgi:hypothetical protein